MKRTVIRYKAKPEAAERNAGLVEKVFEELTAKAPEGVRYLVLRLEDDSFVHIVEMQEGATPLPSLEAFKAFRPAFATAASSRRCQTVLALSAITACCPSIEFPEAAISCCCTGLAARSQPSAISATRLM